MSFRLSGLVIWYPHICILWLRKPYKKITPTAFQQLVCPESIPFVFTGYAIASTTATQLKQAVSLGQDLTAYATYEGYPAFAVTTRGDAYGVF